MLASSYSAHVSVKHPSLHVHVKAVTWSLSARMVLINFQTLGGIWYFSIIALFNCLQELSSLPKGASCLSGPPLQPWGQRSPPHKGAQWTPAKGRTPLHSKGFTYDLWRLKEKQSPFHNITFYEPKIICLLSYLGKTKPRANIWKMHFKSIQGIWNYPWTRNQVKTRHPIFIEMLITYAYFKSGFSV